MGKTTVGGMLGHLGVPVHDSDAAVHGLLKHKSPARPALAALLPYYEYPDLYERKSYDYKRKALGDLIFNDAYLRQEIENILHPFVHADQDEFIAQHKRKGYEMVCLDIPLLFETHADQRVDYTITVSAPAFLQRKRTLSRPGMTPEKLNAILERQMPDIEKRQRSDYVIQTGLNRAHSMRALKGILVDIREKSGLIPEPDLEEYEAV